MLTHSELTSACCAAGLKNAETEVEAERSKEAQDVQLTRGAE